MVDGGGLWGIVEERGGQMGASAGGSCIIGPTSQPERAKRDTTHST